MFFVSFGEGNLVWAHVRQWTLGGLCRHFNVSFSS